MFENEEEPKDWEVPEDQEAPEQLKRKWIVEDMRLQESITCFSCKQPIPYDSLSCLFCGASVYPAKDYLFSKFFAWAKRLFSRGKKPGKAGKSFINR